MPIFMFIFLFPSLRRFINFQVMGWFLNDMYTLHKNARRFFIIIVILTQLWTFIDALSSNGDKFRCCGKLTCRPPIRIHVDFWSPYPLFLTTWNPNIPNYKVRGPNCNFQKNSRWVWTREIIQHHILVSNVSEP